MTNSTMHEVFGDAIYEYTTDTALSDGVLTEPYPERWPNLFMSADVTAACETADLRTSDSDEKLEYIIATLHDMTNIFGVEDDMLARSLAYANSLLKHIKEKARTFDQVTIPFLMDVIMQAQVPKNRKTLSEGSIITLDHTIAGEVFIALNERGGLTVMTPSEY